MRTPSYAQFPTLAISDEANSDQVKWIDLPSHKMIWETADEWLHDLNIGQALTIKGDTGVGKTLWLKEFTKRYRRNRIRVIHAQIPKDQPCDSASVIRHWAYQAQIFEEIPHGKLPHDTLSRRLSLSINSLKEEGYKVILVVESARLPKFDHAVVLETHRIHLQRKVFQGSLNEGLVLAPWSHDELTEVLRERWPQRCWPEELVEQIWSSSLGQGRLAMGLADSISKASKQMNSSLIPDDFIGKVMRTWNLRGIGLAKPTLFEFNNRLSGMETESF